MFQCRLVLTSCECDIVCSDNTAKQARQIHAVTGFIVSSSLKQKPDNYIDREDQTSWI